MGAFLALNGMVAFVFDPIDQGERGQYMGKDGWPKLWGIDAHTQIGLCSIPLGRNTALFEIWNGCAHRLSAIPARGRSKTHRLHRQ